MTTVNETTNERIQAAQQECEPQAMQTDQAANFKQAICKATIEEEVVRLAKEVKRLRQFIRRLAKHQHNPNTGRILYEIDLDYEL